MRPRPRRHRPHRLASTAWPAPPHPGRRTPDHRAGGHPLLRTATSGWEVAADDDVGTAAVPGHGRRPQSRGALDISRPARDRGDPMVRMLPGRGAVPRGHLSSLSGSARAFGEGPRLRAPRSEAVRRKPGNPRRGGPRPWPDRILAEVVISAPPTGPFRPTGPLRPPGPHAAGPASWRPVRKRRRISRFPARGPARSKAELTEIHTCGRAWWTLAFEATGPARLLRGELRATAALVFAQALPGGVIPGTDNSTSYAEWLRGRPVSAPIPPPATRATWA